MLASCPFSTSAISTLLIDNSPDFLRAMMRFLATVPRVEIIGCAKTGHEAIKQVARLQPDLVLMDWDMPEMSGLEATRHLKAQSDAPWIVMLTIHNCPKYRVAAQAAGADGFVAKAQLCEQLLPLIEMLWGQTGEGTPFS